MQSLKVATSTMSYLLPCNRNLVFCYVYKCRGAYSIIVNKSDCAGFVFFVIYKLEQIFEAFLNSSLKLLHQ
jgi:hypothetical protein